jgi:hypothetical protein
LEPDLSSTIFFFVLVFIDQPMSRKEKKSTIKFQKNKLKGVVKKRKEVNKFKKQIQRRQIRRAASKHHKGIVCK